MRSIHGSAIPGWGPAHSEREDDPAGGGAGVLAEPSRSGITPRWQPSPGDLDAVLREVRAKGWALADQDLAPGIRSVATGVRDGDGRVVAAINVTVHAAETSLETLIEEHLPRLLRAAADIGARLGAHRRRAGGHGPAELDLTSDRPGQRRHPTGCHSAAMKEDLHSYLKGGRESLLWKLDGLGEYDIRRPLTPTATNLLGLVKHSAAMEILYFGVVFGRPFEQELPYVGDGAETNADMWASAEETREEIVALYRRAIAHADTTIEALALHEVGHVPWWGGAAVTLHHVLVHVTAETQRHAGHADIVRELIDGAAGLLSRNDNLPPVAESWWLGYRQRVEQAALDASRCSS
ncbi:DUF664 domain-containing protein [Micromonospora sp. NPDC005324]|uniref:mycothiol transferase n=1 Tax=Micromonospora sp. NPDC005324 TaxID=3157033 RepID=UPI0033A25CAF